MDDEPDLSLDHEITTTIAKEYENVQKMLPCGYFQGKLDALKNSVFEKSLPKYFHFKVENVTVTRAPLLKPYYWECLGIDKLNETLGLDENVLEHSVTMPTRQINSKPLKIIFWLRNISNDLIELSTKRIKNCECVPLQTRVGFNQFRDLYHCPHRRMISIMQEYIYMQPNDLVAMSIVFYYYLFGHHMLTFEVRCNDGRKLKLNFFVDVIGFDPNKCIITQELIPVDIREYRRFVQPIWVQNVTMQQLHFQYASRERGLKIINPNLSIPRQSVWPLMVEYRPSDFENQLDLVNSFNGIRTKFPLKASGILDELIPEKYVPIKDYECADFPYVIFPNKLDFIIELSEERTLMVCVHNYNQKCVEFRWQRYIISDLFEITFEPEIFRLKPHHSKLCVVIVRSFERPLHFRRIPTVMEVHRIFDQNTSLAKDLLDEVESIDDPKWKQDSYLEHVFLNVNIKVNFKKEKIIDIPWEAPELVRGKPPPKKKTTTIFEKLFWEYLSKSNFMRENKVSQTLQYEEVLKLAQQPIEIIKTLAVNRTDVLRILSQLTAEGCRDISQNWRFIPYEQYGENI